MTGETATRLRVEATGADMGFREVVNDPTAAKAYLEVVDGATVRGAVSVVVRNDGYTVVITTAAGEQEITGPWPRAALDPPSAQKSAQSPPPPPGAA